MNICIRSLLTIFFLYNCGFALYNAVEHETSNHVNLSADSINVDNETLLATTSGILPTANDAEKEHKYSLSIFFILFVIVLSILLVHVLLVTNCKFIPDSLSIILLGSVIGFSLHWSGTDWRNEEALSPNAFFLLLLPPIIFESGYNLHKGNFFANISSIVVFAVVGTLLSAVVIGSGIFILGQIGFIDSLTTADSFVFGSLISAIDPVATLAIFQAIKVDQMLYMLVFGESMLNDAVSIVLTTSFLEFNEHSHSSIGGATEVLLSLVQTFTIMFFGSAAIGIIAGLFSALLLKYVNLHNTPSLEYGIMFVFAYLPYSLAEGLHLSGIMAILFCGIVMSHYTHHNLSVVTQVTVQQTFRTLSFIAESCVFAYLGMAPFTFPMNFRPAFIFCSLILCLLSRAVNIFPLSYLVNLFRQHRITKEMQFLMWFSGLRGAVAFALSLHASFRNAEIRGIVVSTTYCVVLITTVVLGGSTLPLTKYITTQSRPKRKRNRRRRKKLDVENELLDFTMSKTIELGSTVDSSSYSEVTDSERSRHNTNELSEDDDAIRGERNLSVLMKFDAKYLKPLFTRKFTQKETADSRTKLNALAFKWYKEVLIRSEDEMDKRLINNCSADTTVLLNSNDDHDQKPNGEISTQNEAQNFETVSLA